MEAINLKCEYLINPIGIDVTEPRLFWNCEGGIKQTAYYISAVDEDGNVLWDSGKVGSSQMAHIKWGGERLKSRTRVIWKVKLWNENNEEGEWSDEAFFEMGFLHAYDWQAKWITGNYMPDSSIADKKEKIGKSFFLQGVNFLVESGKPEKLERYPVDCFKHSFRAEKEVKKARLYITACGIYEARLNGKKAGNFCLAPGITDYTKRVQYQTYDVTDLIVDGENEITVDLADGWYRGSVGAWGLKQEYGFETKFIAQLEITYADGTKNTVITDNTWQWSNDGPIRFADNKDGEIVDANKKPTYNRLAKLTSHNVVPTASNNVAVVERERFKPELITTPRGKTILDFKQNFAGYIEFNLTAKRNQKVFLRFGELLDDNGEFTQKNIQCSNKHITTPLQQIDYTCTEGENQYKTRFAIFGFQYVLVETDVPFTADDFTGIAVYSDMEQTGYFESSNELLNKLVHATVWSTKSNSADLPTDCPTRERHGWTGDAQIFFPSASYLFDYATFSKKFLNDMYDWQTKNGKLPQIAPPGGIDFFMSFMNGSVGWSDAGIIIPYYFWKKYNDKDILVEYYDKMKKYAEFMISRVGKNALLSKPHKVKGENRKYIVNSGQSYGEWAEPADVFPNDWTNTVLPHTEVSTAYTSYVLGLMSEIAKELNFNDDAKYYNEISQKCKKSYQALVETEDYSLDTDRQAQLVRPLAFGLLNDEQTEFARKRLIKALDNYGWRLGTGFLSTPLILGVLDKYDLDSAYRLLENEEMPGWLFMPKNGATTIWESWEGTKAQGGIASLNHYSKGAVCQWLFNTMCGINVDGENHFIIAPKPGGHFSFAKAEYKSIFGTVKSAWEKKDEKTVFNITIPANTTADIVLPDGTKRTVTAGTYTF
ncbi:MAG: family 78 glycoside hydrolase catalytic domain [Acutalibacteraceae bacterium]